MQAIVDTLTNYYNGFIGFFIGIFSSIKSFFDAILGTIINYWDSFVTYFGNVFKSLKLFLLDLPLLALDKALDSLVWLFSWVSESCSYCLGAGESGVSSFSSTMQAAFNALSPTILYCLERSEFSSAMKIITCGLVVWSALKLLSIVVGFIKGLL